MMNGLIGIAVFFWCLATLLAYVFNTDPSEPFLKRIGHSFRLDFHHSAGLKVIPSMFQAISIYWIVLGVIINWVGEAWLEEYSGEAIPLLLIGAPIMAAAILAEKRKNKGA